LIYVAILGYGVVGSGIWQVLAQNRTYIERKASQPIEVKRVLDTRKFPGNPVEKVLTSDYADILKDKDIQIIAEAIGGLEPAYSYVKQALLANKHVCTSNKELVIKHGAELLALAKERGLNFMFEASVGGGIPIVRPMNLSLTTDEVIGVAGILNGTTNYILTQMSMVNKNFEEALAEAQERGYAEKNPTADVEGYDSCRKLAILLSLAIGRQVNYEAIHTEGITALTQEDFAFATHFGYVIKLMADGRITSMGIEALTVPMLIHSSHPLSMVADVFNGVLVQARMTDSVMFFGRGAGKLPTASAVVSDIVDISKHLDQHIEHIWSTESAMLLPLSSYRRQKMIRVSFNDRERAMSLIQEYMEPASIVEISEYSGQLAWLSQCEPENKTIEKLARLAESKVFIGEPRILRIFEPTKSDE
jgi:homoserine dehydrogenase